MGLFDEIKAAGASYRLTEEVLFAEVLREVESGIRRDGLWAKALADADGDEVKAKGRYLKLRVQSLKDEANLLMAQIKFANQQRPEIEKREREQQLIEAEGRTLKEALIRRYEIEQAKSARKSLPWRQRFLEWWLLTASRAKKSMADMADMINR
jgi:hypothetical protein